MECSRRTFVIGAAAVAAGAWLLIGPAGAPADFRTTEARLGTAHLTVEFATTTADRARGLSGRTDVPDGYGMLFAFKDAGRYGFWMKDMLVPIDIIWLEEESGEDKPSIGRKGQILKVIGIAESVLPESYPNVFYPPAPIRYVLETRAGFAAANGIATGTPFTLKNFPIVSE